jgi:hypothetical protein
MKYLRPLSKSMIEKLKICHEKEIYESDNPCTMEDMNYAVAPLYKRGLIETKKRVINNKTLVCIYVTPAGREFLKKLETIQ